MSFEVAGLHRLFKLYIFSMPVLPCSTSNRYYWNIDVASSFRLMARYTVSDNQYTPKGVSFIDTSDVFMLHYIHCFGHRCCIPLPHHSDSTQTDAGFFLTPLQLSSHNPTSLQNVQ